MEMEGQSSSLGFPLQLIPCSTGTSGATDVSHMIERVQNPQSFMYRRDKNHWNSPPQPSPTYVQYLSENTTYLTKSNNTDEVMLGSNCPPPDSVDRTNGVNEMHRNLYYNEMVKAVKMEPGDSAIFVDAKNVHSLGQIWKPDILYGQANKSSQVFSRQKHVLCAPESGGHNHVTSRVHQSIQIPATGSPSQPKQNLTRKVLPNDRERRIRLSEKLNALQELLPHALEGCQANVVDDIIDHVKYLQLQIKELSRSRLQSEPTATRLIYREGYGHFIDNQMFNEPLEEMIGKLLEDQEAAADFLEREGLFLLPMAYAEDVPRAL